mmetsp:Transcript_57923/g.131258  ORF Transcript_57923/g.131258 Transcript_57923/m.131258 type:complete len:207 (+) Transcript_57923:498-1118(+)
MRGAFKKMATTSVSRTAGDTRDPALPPRALPPLAGPGRASAPRLATHTARMCSVGKACVKPATKMSAAGRSIDSPPAQVSQRSASAHPHQAASPRLWVTSPTAPLGLAAPATAPATAPAARPTTKPSEMGMAPAPAWEPDAGAPRASARAAPGSVAPAAVPKSPPTRAPHAAPTHNPMPFVNRRAPPAPFSKFGLKTEAIRHAMAP